MDLLRTSKWISYNFLHLVDLNVLVVICMFLHWTEVYHVERLVPLLWVKSSWKILSLPGELLSNFIVIKEPVFTGLVPQQVCAVWLVLPPFHCVYHHPSSGLIDHDNCMTKIQAGKICQGPPNTLAKSNAIGPSKSQIHTLGNL